MEYFIISFLLIRCVYSNVNSPDYFLMPQTNVCTKNDYFNPVTFSCKTCDISKQLTPDPTYNTCVCNNQSVPNGWDSNGYSNCTKCLDDEIPSLDKTFCIKLPVNATKFSICDKFSIIVDRHQNGTKLNRITCIVCLNGTIPNKAQTQCNQCNYAAFGCICPSETHEILDNRDCVPKNKLPLWWKNADMYEIEYESTKLEAKLFRYKVLSTYYWCKNGHYSNCQYLANLCVLSMYQDQTGPCKLFKEIEKVAPKKDSSMPSIYYNAGDAHSIVNKKKILKRYRLNKHFEDSYLDLYVAKWALNGSWMGFDGGMNVMKICRDMNDMAIRFAVEYKKSCTVSSKEISKEFSTIFYDMYLRYHISNETYLYPIPVLNLNYKHQNNYPNRDGDSHWQLTHRFFVLESPNDYYNEANVYTVPRIIRYLKSVTLRVRVRNGADEGLIYTPLLVITYGELTKEDIDKNKPKTFSFKTEFLMDNNVKRNVDIALGVLCSISVIWSLIRAWAYTRRSGQRPIDLVAVLHLCIISCGHLANVFFFVISATALHNFVYYKGQAIAHVLLPTPRLHYLVKTYVIVAFPLKMFELFVLIWHHVTIDIFLIDWEQPRAQKQTLLDVSAWRTYFVANKWSEIQTVRKTSVLMQLSLVVFFLKVCGIEHWALNVPELHTSRTSDTLLASDERVFRFALAVIVYISVYLIQWMILGGLYERYVKNAIQEFVDICSLANISLFVLSLENYGFYVHGRSAHGFSDTDMATLRKQLRREEEDLVRHRGLVPESDHQTFQILIPPKLRIIYRSLLTNLPHEHNRFNITNLKKPVKTVSGLMGDHTMQAYVTINRFLAAFIEHALKDLDYEVKDKLFIEALLDIEIYDSRVKGIFYNDNGHSFDSVLYYGNELTLFTFDLILFCFIEILAQNFLLAAILTGLCDETIARIRRYCSRKNFAKKALIDEHFLL